MATVSIQKFMLARKLETFKRVYRTNGMQGIREVLAHKVSNCDLRALGWFVERTGNRVWVEGCTFDVRNPQISRQFKGNLLMQRHEFEIRDIVRGFVDWELPLVELGGSIGIVSCICNQYLKDASQQVVVEANPFLIPLLEAARERNHSKFSILQNAVGYGTGDKIQFHRDPHSVVSGSLAPQATPVIEVAPISLQEILEKFGFAQACVICDIEGTEVELVERELDTLRKHVKVLVVEWHDFIVDKKHVQDSKARLQAAGFELVRKRGIVSGYVNRNL